MRLTIDCSPLLVNSAGVKTYLHHLFLALQAASGGDSVHGFPFLSSPGPLRHTSGIYSNPLRVAVVLGLNYGMLPTSTFSETDVFHISNLLHRAPRGAKITATVHDLTSWLFPERHKADNAANDYRFAEKILKKSDGLIAVSEATRQDAIRILGVDERRIRTVHSGVAPEYFRVQQAQIDEVKKRFDLKVPYLLAVGTIEPRKNLDRLIEAWTSLPSDLRHDFHLLLAGAPGWKSEETLARLRSLTPQQDGVRFLGYVPERDLPALTAGATAAIHPSLYEGFGFPVVQAMAAGVPVITSNCSAMPEVAGDAALYIDPYSVASLRDGIRQMLESPSLRTRLEASGRTRAKQFTWERSAAESWKFFRDVAAS